MTGALLAVDAVGFFVGVVKPEWALQSWAYLSALGLAIVWAGFDAFRSERGAHARTRNALAESEYRLATATGKAPAEILPPELRVRLIAGNEYDYAVLTPYQAFIRNRARDESGEPTAKQSEEQFNEEQFNEEQFKRLVASEQDYTIPRSYITLHLRVENVGRAPVDILAIKADFPTWTAKRTPMGELFYFGLATPVGLRGEELHFPLPLQPDSVLLCDMESNVEISGGLNVAQFAARLAHLGADVTDSITVTLSVECPAPPSGIARFTHDATIALHPLRDYYIDYWRQLGRDDLVRLARPESRLAGGEARDSGKTGGGDDD